MTGQSVSAWLIGLVVVTGLLSPATASDDFTAALEKWTPPQLTADEWSAGWISLFDGETLYGWKNEGDADFHVKNQAIVATQASTPCLLRTTSQFSDYELRVQFLAGPNTNSGVFLHTPPQPTDPQLDCYELNIAPPAAHPFPTGSLVGRAAVEPEQLATARRAGEWQTLVVRVVGGTIQVWLNGHRLTEYDDPRPLGRGFIGLQFNSGRIAFGQVWLKPLGLEDLFNGQNLEGWKTHPGLDGEFTVRRPELLHVRGGRGQLESEARFGDFVLQLQCRTNAPGLNSGVFFRCIPGEQMNGYESQIHNGYQEGDRSQPSDFGTGGIFRRQPARRIVAEDETWFTKTLVAVGPHIAVWVNGVQVCDWTDKRPPDPNPRRGRREAPGTLMLQAHDPTTDLDFRRLRAAELRPRNR